MNIQFQGINLTGNYGLKSVQDRMDRQTQRDNQIAFFEQQKENLKNMKTDSLEDIARKLELLHGYDDQIIAAKTEYNHSQMFHILDEAREVGEKIADAAEKSAPKTPEERREEMIEEATGIEKADGLLSDMLDEMEDVIEEMEDSLEESMEESVEALDQQLSEADLEETIDETSISAGNQITSGLTEDERLLEKYKRIDIRI